MPHLTLLFVIWIRDKSKDSSPACLSSPEVTHLTSRWQSSDWLYDALQLGPLRYPNHVPPLTTWFCFSVKRQHPAFQTATPQEALDGALVLVLPLAPQEEHMDAPQGSPIVSPGRVMSTSQAGIPNAVTYWFAQRQKDFDLVGYWIWLPPSSFPFISQSGPLLADERWLVLCWGSRPHRSRLPQPPRPSDTCLCSCSI